MDTRSRRDGDLGKCLFTFAVIADTHLRPEEGDESSPWEVNLHANARAHYAVALLNQIAPAFVIHLGDIVHPVPELPSYDSACEAAKAAFGHLTKAVYYVPGNHDVGDKPSEQMPAGQIQEAFVAKYERHFGMDYSSFDHGDCHFTLIDAQLVNSGYNRELLQWSWLERDLSEHSGKRIFLFSHYPPYICDAAEASHYDNMDEPGRSRLMKLVEQHSVEALFCGHVHGFFYNRHGNSDSYTLPATSFFRQDYSELFRIGPVDEFGRNDVGKLGFFLVTIYESGHVVRLVRTGGKELAPGERVHHPCTIPTLHTKEMKWAPVGVHLRHPWNEITELPYNGPLEEFSRKRARNDYTLLALWELGIRKIRVPLAELLNEATRARLTILKRIGHEITAFVFDAPTGALEDALVRHRDLVDALEIVLQWRNVQSLIPALNQIRREARVPVHLAKVETSADKKRTGSRFSHFVSYGFRSTEIAEIDEFLGLTESTDAVTGYVFRIGLDKSPWDEIVEISSLASNRKTKAVINIRLASDNPAEMNNDDQLIANQIAETLVAAFSVGNVDVFLDTFVDLDRGYFPRHGLFDRRFNPRLSAFVFRHLNSWLPTLTQPITLGERRICPAGVACSFRSGARKFHLLLPRESSIGDLTKQVELLPLLSTSMQTRWINLETGELTESLPNQHSDPDSAAPMQLTELSGPTILLH